MTRLILSASMVALGLLSTSLPAADKFRPDAGFARIDNGKDLNGWAGARNLFAVNDDGVIQSRSKDKGTMYAQKRHEDDAIIRLEFKAVAGSRGGVHIWGKELQIGDFAKSGSREYAGAAKALGQWNELEFDITRGQAVIKLNNKVIEKSWQIGRDSNKGIGLEHDVGEIEFRHLQQKNKDKK